MATQTPIVASPAAVQGIGGRRDEHFLVGDTADELAAACERLLTGPDEGEDLAAQAWEYVVAHHSWEQKADQYEAVLRSAMEAWRIGKDGRPREIRADR
jgi:glycosyltransferase involved in cell wall biosynthesis